MTEPMMTLDEAERLGLTTPVPPQLEIKAAYVIVAESDLASMQLRASIPTDPTRPVAVVDFDHYLALPGARGAVPVRVVVDVATLTGYGIDRETGQTFTPSADLLRQAISASPAALDRLREGGDPRRIAV
jgi:hypothetical protein